MLSESSYLQFTPDLKICRILNGMWQVSGAHGAINRSAAIRSMSDYVNAGFTTWDLADHYGPAEDFIGEFQRQQTSDIQAFTKWVPRPGKMTRSVVEDNVNLALRRMKVSTLDLMQFHWWDYRDRNYLEALKYLVELQHEGKIKHVALTNFDTERLQIIHDSGIKIVSNQVQFSIIDQRPLVEMTKFCEQHGIYLLAYGTVCGGLLSDRSLEAPEPESARLTTASLRKYKNMINVWGGWSLFQELLSVLNEVAQKYQVSIANVAVRFVLEQPTVAGAIVGARLGVSEHIEETQRVFDFTLDPADYEKIRAVTARSRNLFQAIGDCGDEYRR